MGTSYSLKMKAVDNVGNEMITNTVTKTVTKPISSVKEKDYVYYTDKSGIRRKCIVLYGPTSGKGIQIITEGDVSKVVIGAENSDECIASYNGALKQLYDTAQIYLNTNLASSARCVGSRADITFFYENSGYAGIMAWGKHMINDFSQYRGCCQLWDWSSTNQATFRSEIGFRPVFKLRSDVKILSGDGTSTNPYVLGD